MKQTDTSEVDALWKDLGFEADMFNEAKITTLGDAMLRLAPHVEVLRARVHELSAENELLQRELQRYREKRPPAPRVQE